MTKYKKYFQEMVNAHQSEFEAFKKVHDLYKTNPGKWSEEFNKLGKPVVAIVTEWESRLCSNIEGGKNSVFSSNLADKFKEEVKKYLSLIDMVGVKITYKTVS